MNKKRFFYGTVAALMTMAAFTSCNDEDSIKKGNLSGTTWVRQVSDKSSVLERNETFTIKFTSKKEGTFSHTGSSKVYSYSDKKWKTTNYNDNDKFTYLYADEIKDGYWEYASGNKVIFSISSDNQTLSASGANYTKK